MDSLIFWSDNVRLYGFTVWTLFFVSLVLALLPAIQELLPDGLRQFVPSGLTHPAWFLVSAVLLLFAGRWPGVFYNSAYSVDEAQILAAAQVLTIDPVFFRSAECGSSGPIVVYPLLLSKIFGCDPSLFSARVIGLAMLAGCAVTLRGICETFCRPATARTATLAAVVFFAFTRHWDFVHYTSEHAPLFFLFCGLWCVCNVEFHSIGSTRKFAATACAGAVLFSIVPFAKLQAAYLGLFSGTLLVIVVLFRRDLPFRKRLVIAGMTAFCALAFPLLLILMALVTGSGDYLLNSYFGNALAYVESGFSTGTSFLLMWKLLVQSADIVAFAAGSLLFALAAVSALLAPSTARLDRRLLGFSLAGFLLLALAICAVLSPRRDYGHYLIFLPFFLALFAASLSGLLVRRAADSGLTPRSQSAYELGCSALLALFLIFPAAGLRWESGNPWAGSGRYWSQQAAKPQDPVVLAIKKAAAKSNRRMTVWGYMPYYYIETGLRQATRLSTSSAMFNDNPLRPFFVATYLEDLKRNRPDVFVDAVAPGSFMMNVPEQQAFERIPEVADYIRANYSLAREVNGIRIFRRNKPGDNE
ncbi:MAG: hypothetical protein WCO94_00185 [Verrucomicrobiota bacterium]